MAFKVYKMTMMVAVVSDVDHGGDINDKIMVAVLNIASVSMAGWYQFRECW